MSDDNYWESARRAARGEHYDPSKDNYFGYNSGLPSNNKNKDSNNSSQWIGNSSGSFSGTGAGNGIGLAILFLIAIVIKVVEVFVEFFRTYFDQILIGIISFISMFIISKIIFTIYSMIYRKSYISRKEYSVCSCRVPSSGGYGEELVSFYVSRNTQAKIIQDVKCGRSPSEDPRLIKAVLHEDSRIRNKIRKKFAVISFFISAVFGLVVPLAMGHLKERESARPVHSWAEAIDAGKEYVQAEVSVKSDLHASPGGQIVARIPQGAHVIVYNPYNPIRDDDEWFVSVQPQKGVRGQTGFLRRKNLKFEFVK